ncbi:MAG: putative metal-binding protein (TIGR02443 family) [Oleiphilaceae bacterium]|jgi:uncharacterized metal-binding protein (TIGR02443 family)
MSVKRFIAGAVCPRCGEMDRLLTYSNNEGTFKECVSCDFEEKQLVQVDQGEIETRVNQLTEVESRDENSVQVVKIMEPPK